MSCRMDSVDIIGCKTGIFSSVCLHHVLNIQSTRGSDVDTSVIREGATIAFSPGHSRLWLACGAALQGHALSYQYLCVLWLNHKTWPCWRSRGRGEDGPWEKVLDKLVSRMLKNLITHANDPHREKCYARTYIFTYIIYLYFFYTYLHKY